MSLDIAFYRASDKALTTIGSNRIRYVHWFFQILVSPLPLSCPKSEPYRQADGVAGSAMNTKLCVIGRCDS
jgi:hypothetical protein